MNGRWALVLGLIVVAFFFFGCAGDEERIFDDNLRGLESVTTDPAKGSPAERTYFNTAYKGRDELGAARVGKVTVTPTRNGEEEIERFVERLTMSAEKGAYEALRDAKRFAKVYRIDAGKSAEFELETDILAHIAIVQGVVVKDPVHHEPRSMMIAVYTLKDLSNGEIVLRYTTNSTAHFENPPDAMGELEVDGRELAYELIPIFSEM